MPSAGLTYAAEWSEVATVPHTKEKGREHHLPAEVHRAERSQCSTAVVCPGYPDIPTTSHTGLPHLGVGGESVPDPLGC